MSECHQPSSWSSKLAWIEFAPESLTWIATGFSPFEACLGYQLLRAYKYIRGQRDVWSRCPCVCENREGEWMTVCAVAKHTHTHSYTWAPPLLQAPPVYSLYLNPLFSPFPFFLVTYDLGLPFGQEGHGQDSWGQQESCPNQIPSCLLPLHPMTRESPLNFCHPIPRPS